MNRSFPCSLLSRSFSRSPALAGRPSTTRLAPGGRGLPQGARRGPQEGGRLVHPGRPVLARRRGEPLRQRSGRQGRAARGQGPEGGRRARAQGGEGLRPRGAGGEGDQRRQAGDRALDLVSDAEGEPTVLEMGSLSFFVIQRGDTVGVRVKDKESAALAAFHGLDTYPIQPAWRVEARFEPYDPPKTIGIPNILGQVTDSPSPGAVVFDWQGKTYRLDALGDAEGGALPDLRRPDQRQGDLRRRPLPGDRPGQGRQGRGGLQPGLQPALRLHGLRHLPAAARPEPAGRSGSKRARRSTPAPRTDLLALRVCASNSGSADTWPVLDARRCVNAGSPGAFDSTDHPLAGAGSRVAEASHQAGTALRPDHELPHRRRAARQPSQRGRTLPGTPGHHGPRLRAGRQQGGGGPRILRSGTPSTPPSGRSRSSRAAAGAT